MVNIVTEKIYKPLDNSLTGVVIMVKNESKRILVTLESIKNIANAIIVYDTGSTDNTIEIITNFCEKNKLNLFLISGEFVDFSTSRNVLLEYAEKVSVKYLLLLDCNDELQGETGLIQFMKEMESKNENAFLVCQHWFSGMNDKYYNIRLIKNNCGWRYRDPIHEWLKDTTIDGDSPRYPVNRIPDSYGIVIYQDRTQDDDKTGKRFRKDFVILLQEHEKRPDNPRILFYLAQTCQSLGMNREALEYSIKRLELQGFQEERFHSFMRCGNCCKALDKPFEESIGWFMKAYEHSPRVEPLIAIADLYRFRALKEKTHSLWQLSYMFIVMACKLDYPHWCSLFVDKGMYDYYRWHLAGIVFYYVGDFENGKLCCLKALETGRNIKVDSEVLKFYTDRESKMAPEIISRGPPEIASTENKLEYPFKKDLARKKEKNGKSRKG